MSSTDDDILGGDIHPEARFYMDAGMPFDAALARRIRDNRGAVRMGDDGKSYGHRMWALPFRERAVFGEQYVDRHEAIRVASEADQALRDALVRAERAEAALKVLKAAAAKEVETV
jgi:hypothetical protein